MNMQIVAKKLISLRQSQNWTQEDMAEKLHISRQAISKWETGESLPNVEILLKLSKIYNTTMNEIIEPTADKCICNFEDIINIDKIKLKAILESFTMSEIVKSSMGASPTINELFKNLFDYIDFNKEKMIIGSVKIDEIEQIHNKIVDMINVILSEECL